jgi:hypothetical protein
VHLSYAPKLRGWDSNPRLELMRLARLPLLHRALAGHAAEPRGLLDGIASDAFGRPRGRAARPLRRHRKRRLSLVGRSRTCDLRFPIPAGWPTPPQPVDKAPSAGFEPAASGLRVRRHCLISTTRAWSSGNRIRTCASRVTVARRTDSTIPERKAEAGLEPANGWTVYAPTTRRLAKLGHASSGRRGNRTPRP